MSQKKTEPTDGKYGMCLISRVFSARGRGPNSWELSTEVRPPDVSVALQQRANITSQCRKVGLQRFPHELIIDVGVLVDDYIAERNDATVPTDMGDRVLIDRRNLAYRFTDDGDLASTAERSISSLW